MKRFTALLAALALIGSGCASHASAQPARHHRATLTHDQTPYCQRVDPSWQDICDDNQYQGHETWKPTADVNGYHHCYVMAGVPGGIFDDVDVILCRDPRGMPYGWYSTTR